MDLFVRILVAAGLPEPVPEFCFSPPRRFRFDLCWPREKVAFEREGGVWRRGRHNRPQGYMRDIVKYNLAALQGWIVVRATPEQMESGQALAWLTEALRQRRVDV